MLLWSKSYFLPPSDAYGCKNYQPMVSGTKQASSTQYLPELLRALAEHRAERQQERQAEEIRSQSSLLSRTVTLWTHSKQKACCAGKENQARSQHQREARYDVSFHQSSAHTN